MMEFDLGFMILICPFSFKSLMVSSLSAMTFPLTVDYSASDAELITEEIPNSVTGLMCQPLKA